MDSGFATAIQGAELTAIVFTVLLTFFFATHRKTPAAPWWLAHSALQAVAMHLYTLRADSWFGEAGQSWGFVALTIGLPGFLIAICAGCLFHGFWKLVELPGFSRPVMALLAIELALHGWFTFVHPDLSMRTLILSLFLMLMTAYAAVTLVRHAGADIRNIARGISVIWLLLALGYLLRAHAVAGQMMAGIKVSPILASSQTFVFSAAANAFWAMGAVLISIQREKSLARRVNAEMAARERERIVEEQRMRLSRDLHDALSGITATIGVLAASGLKDASDGHSRDSLEKIQRLARNANAEVRSLLNKLTRTELSMELWLAELREMAFTLADAGGLDLQWNSQGFDGRPIGEPLAAVNLLRAVKEAIQNTLQHSAATQLRLEVSAFAERLELVVTDDGCGIPEDFIPGRGLANILTRIADQGGTLVFENTPGARIAITLPLPLRFVSGSVD